MRGRYTSPAVSTRRCRRVPAILDEQEPPGPEPYSLRFVSSEASGASRRLFYAVAQHAAPVFENSTANVQNVETSSSRPLRRAWGRGQIHLVASLSSRRQRT